MNKPVVVILAAGQGTRMRSRTPKLLHEICGLPMIAWPVAAARTAGASKVIVVDAPGAPLRPHLADDVTVVVQQQALGTGDALKAALPEITAEDTVIVLYGDVPLLSAGTVQALAAAHAESGSQATVTSTVLEDPTGWGRVVRAEDGSVAKIVETRKPGDATPEEMRIREVNTGIYAFSGDALIPALAEIRNENAQGEYYLTDVPMIMRRGGGRVTVFQLPDAAETFNVNDRVQLAQAVSMAQRGILERHMLAGATIVSPQNTVIDANVMLGEDVTIEPGTALHGSTSVASGATIGPHSTLIDATIAAGAQVLHSYLVGAVIGEGATVGPFSYMRPGTVLRDSAKVGSFVETKNADIGARTKVPHLSYIGDATVGEDTNLGAGTTTANYDGYGKHRTAIGSHVHTGVNTVLAAPVTVADNSWTGAGSVIDQDLPEGALGIARPRQTTIEGYDDRVKARHASESDHTGSD